MTDALGHLALRGAVLALDESLVQFEGQDSFVEVETAPQQFEKRKIETGLSDGITIEVVSGLTDKDKIKKPLAAPSGS